MNYSQYTVHSPQTLNEALGILKEKQSEVRLIAGGTDVMVLIKDGVLKEKELLNLSYLDELKYIREDGNIIKVGALTTYRELEKSSVVNLSAPILVDACKTIGATQIQNLGTLAGNLGNASPAGDSLPPLYVLNANVKLQSAESERIIPVSEFFLGPRKTKRAPNELITEITIEKAKPGLHYFFKKLGLREANAISLVSVACIVDLDKDKKINSIKLALGAVAPTVMRAVKSEKLATGRQLDLNLIDEIARGVSEEISPITDIRGSAEYRRRAAYGLVYEGLYEALMGTAKRISGGIEGVY
ncbi:MAG: xanthine dehydrogenase family protein subunit M [Nitrososphaerota archaeon]|nr:xanthine dehydrogenase family protein subunit M [Nitrososphaerota archaeon]MDG6930399.1 xanthine dehydrogenase family protein subunit M [Nitrososphaerota archaeon]